MSYSYALADRALAQFRALDPWLAEELLDELESLSHKGPPKPRSSSVGFVQDFVRDRERETVYVFLTVVPNVPRQVLLVTSIGTYLRSKPS